MVSARRGRSSTSRRRMNGVSCCGSSVMMIFSHTQAGPNKTTLKPPLLLPAVTCPLTGKTEFSADFISGNIPLPAKVNRKQDQTAYRLTARAIPHDTHFHLHYLFAIYPKGGVF